MKEKSQPRKILLEKIRKPKGRLEGSPFDCEYSVLNTVKIE